MVKQTVNTWLDKWSHEPSFYLAEQHSGQIQSDRRAAPQAKIVTAANVYPKTAPHRRALTSTTPVQPSVDTSTVVATNTLVLPPEELKKKRASARRWASILPALAALAKAMKDSFGAMCLYSLVVCLDLKLTAALLNPWVGLVIVVLGIALFCISLGMEGKSLRETILNWMSKRSGIDLTQEEEALKPVKGMMNRFGVYLAIGLSKFLGSTAPWTAAICKGFAGFGACAGCMLLLLAGAGVIATTALIGPIPWIVIGISAILGVTTALVSRYKEGKEFMLAAQTFEGKCWERLALIQDGTEMSEIPQPLPSAERDDVARSSFNREPAPAAHRQMLHRRAPVALTVPSAHHDTHRHSITLPKLSVEEYAPNVTPLSPRLRHYSGPSAVPQSLFHSPRARQAQTVELAPLPTTNIDSLGRGWVMPEMKKLPVDNGYKRHTITQRDLEASLAPLLQANANGRR